MQRKPAAVVAVFRSFYTPTRVVVVGDPVQCGRRGRATPESHPAAPRRAAPLEVDGLFVRRPRATERKRQNDTGANGARAMQRSVSAGQGGIWKYGSGVRESRRCSGHLPSLGARARAPTLSADTDLPRYASRRRGAAETRRGTRPTARAGLHYCTHGPAQSPVALNFQSWPTLGTLGRPGPGYAGHAW